MNRYTYSDMTLFNSLGRVREMEGYTCLIERGDLLLHITRLEEGTYEASLEGKSRYIQAKASRVRLEDALNTVLYRYKKKAVKVEHPCPDIEDMGERLYKWRRSQGTVRETGVKQARGVRQ